MIKVLDKFDNTYVIERHRFGIVVRGSIPTDDFFALSTIPPTLVAAIGCWNGSRPGVNDCRKRSSARQDVTRSAPLGLHSFLLFPPPLRISESGPAAKTKENRMSECRRCADCEDQRHHWMEDESEITEGEMVYACKHCDFEASADESTFLETVDGTDYFLFVCEGCGEAGDLGIAHAEGMKQFNCPSQCGASYIRWNDPIKARPSLKCVVCPVFA